MNLRKCNIEINNLIFEKMLLFIASLFSYFFKDSGCEGAYEKDFGFVGMGLKKWI